MNIVKEFYSSEVNTGLGNNIIGAGIGWAAVNINTMLDSDMPGYHTHGTIIEGGKKPILKITKAKGDELYFSFKDIKSGVPFDIEVEGNIKVSIRYNNISSIPQDLIKSTNIQHISFVRVLSAALAKVDLRNYASSLETVRFENCDLESFESLHCEIVTKDFSFDFGRLKSLKGSPEKLTGTFNLRTVAGLTSLEYGPKYIEGALYIYDIKLTDLRYFPVLKSVTAYNDCMDGIHLTPLADELKLFKSFVKKMKKSTPDEIQQSYIAYLDMFGE